MRILIADTVRIWGGAQRFVLDAALGLRARGHEIWVQAYPGRPLAQRVANAELPLMLTRTRADGAFWTVLPLVDRLRREPFDLVLTLRDKDLRTTGLAQRLAGGGPVLHSRECDEPIKSRPHYRWFYERVAERILVNSQATLRTTVDSAPWLRTERVRVLPKGIELSEFAPSLDLARGARDWRNRVGLREGELLIGFAGQLVPRKRCGLLLDLLAQEPLRERSWRLAIAGTGKESEALRERAGRLGIGDRVHFCGFVESMAPWWAALDLFVLPSLIEGFGYVLAEAAAAGVPAVAFDASSVPEVVRAGVTALLAPPDDAAAMVTALARLLDSPALRSRLGEAARRDARTRHDLQLMIDRLEAELEGLAGRKSGPSPNEAAPLHREEAP